LIPTSQENPILCHFLENGKTRFYLIYDFKMAEGLWAIQSPLWLMENIEAKNIVCSWRRGKTGNSGWRKIRGPEKYISFTHN
jgi:hypothetical protein